MLWLSPEGACPVGPCCLSCAVRSEAGPWRVPQVSPAWMSHVGSSGADGASHPFHLLHSLGRQPLARPAALRGSRQAGILRRPRSSGDSAARGSVSPGRCVLSGLAPGTPRRRGLGASSTPERLELGFRLGESSVPPAPTTVTWKTTRVTATALDQLGASPHTPPHLCVLTAPPSPPAGRPPWTAGRACAA